VFVRCRLGFLETRVVRLRQKRLTHRTLPFVRFCRICSEAVLDKAWDQMTISEKLASLQKQLGEIVDEVRDLDSQGDLHDVQTHLNNTPALGEARSAHSAVRH
jgi:hypothetical protein